MARAQRRTTGFVHLDRQSPVPLWAQLHDDLRRRLESGAFADEFPSELTLVEQYEVSRNTVREALRRLRDEGIVIAGRGLRPRLAAPAEIEQPLGALYSLFTSVEASGAEQRSVVRALELRTDADAAAHLALDPRTSLLYLERLRLADDEPLAIDRVWLPGELAGDLLDADFTHAGFYDELSTRTTVRLTGGNEHIRAVSPTRAERALLQMPTGVAAFFIERLGCSDERAVEWRETLVRADRFSVVAAFSARTGYQLATSSERS